MWVEVQVSASESGSVPLSKPGFVTTTGRVLARGQRVRALEWLGIGWLSEEDLLRRTASDGPEQPVLIDYGITDDDRDNFQLPCGGRIRLLVEPLHSADAAEHVAALASALDRREPVLRRVRLDAPRSLSRPWVSPVRR